MLYYANINIIYLGPRRGFETKSYITMEVSLLSNNQSLTEAILQSKSIGLQRGFNEPFPVSLCNEG